MNGPYPLIVFVHGASLTPATYTRLLRGWARAGYVVAAPVFPLTSANASPVDLSDLANQPGDVRFVISRLATQSAARVGPLSGLIDRRRIAVGGHSIGGDTALAVVYDRRSPLAPVSAAVILSGAPMSAFTGFTAPGRGTGLLFAQGTADPLVSPATTDAYYQSAPRPKYLLGLIGATHQAPYQDQQPFLRSVERVTIAFLDRYLKHDTRTGQRLLRLGSVPGVSTLKARP